MQWVPGVTLPDIRRCQSEDESIDCMIRHKENPYPQTTICPNQRPSVGRPSGVTVAIQRSAGDRTIVEHIDHLMEYVEDSDEPRTSWLANDLQVDAEVNSQNPGCGTQIPGLPTPSTGSK